jgi:hypothetical protein
MTLLLKEILRLDHLDAFQNNIVVAVCCILYTKIALESIAWLRVRHSIHSASYYSRSLVYGLLSTTILFWPLYDVTDWSWRLNAVVPLAMLCRFFYKVNKNEKDGMHLCEDGTQINLSH